MTADVDLRNASFLCECVVPMAKIIVNGHWGNYRFNWIDWKDSFFI